MWLVSTFIAALLFTGLYLKLPKLRFEIPSLMLWGATVMILIDHILGYEGENFFEMTTDGLVSNSIVLGLLMLIPVIITWILIILIKKPKKN